MGMPGLQQKDLRLAFAGEPRCDHAAGGPAPNDNMVGRLRHGRSPSISSLRYLPMVTVAAKTSGPSYDAHYKKRGHLQL